MAGIKPREVTITLPPFGRVTFVANEVEQKAAWKLYFEFSTRVSGLEFNSDHSTLRSAIESLRRLCTITREILGEAGPEVAHGDKSLGMIAIKIMTENLTPFLSKWSFRLKEHEDLKPSNISLLTHEKDWVDYSNAVNELISLQKDLTKYIDALGVISGAKICNGAR